VLLRANVGVNFHLYTLRREAPKAARIRQLRAKGDGILKIGRTLGIGTSVVQRVVGAAG
jgi:hypothetical protein